MALPRIKEIRQKLGMTQAEFSDYLAKEKNINISRARIAKYELGINTPSDDTLNKLSEALNVPQNYLAGKGINEEDIDETLTNTLHNAYFNSYSNYVITLEEDPQKMPYKLKRLIDSYLDLNQRMYYSNILYDSPKFNPLIFYQDNTGEVSREAIKAHFPRSKKIDKFWKKTFEFLYNDFKFKKTLIGLNKEKFSEKVTERIEQQYKQDKLKYDTDSLLNTIEKFSSDLKLDVYEWQNSKKTKDELDENIDEKIYKLNKAISKLGFGKNVKSEQ
ncbi:helix-turn-helix transcriptional regulator [Lactobacillus sp. ESL0731]|uniref:helix-turn-helix domain-containing protein n=1 Tax=unclassified Lactobacillus TaxID=2620435 RepID=UPI0023F7F24A|nr:MULTISPECIES: helix-turn-helix transcriptional regulator [unclassified Lactobacillus]WEV51162.1 helix-turn-helix transcriptional regulator [Lactobacillus sp. ESL0700]WEV62292.1 helix-turn-helix transcriptional regulator [Lactobacillus sp. ESL0731]